MEKKMLEYEISEEYGPELSKIQNKLNQLEKGRVYELSKAQMDGYLSTNVHQLHEMINDLLGKIQYGKPGIKEDMRKASEIMSSILK